ncbi:hypothetical protein TNCV_2981551 [Trichonephila clavipes]|nr:hypothetical protein TNCV_2981551 [Trichonephila clavipes]
MVRSPGVGDHCSKSSNPDTIEDPRVERLKSIGGKQIFGVWNTSSGVFLITRPKFKSVRDSSRVASE